MGKQKNIEIKGKLKIKGDVKRLDNALINIMLKTVVPLEYSYVCNDELKKSVFRINKSVKNVQSKKHLEKEVLQSFLKHP